MTPAEIARAMGAYIRKNGFSPDCVRTDKCGCFAHAYDAVGAAPTRHWGNSIFFTLMTEVVGSDIWTDDLIAAGWTSGPKVTRDAAAACDIAADLLS